MLRSSKNPIAMNRMLRLPASAVTQTVGFIGRKGSGKSYAAGRFCEQLYSIGAPFNVIDPVGNWFGLKLARDGVSPGLPIAVLGGEYGDMELHPGAARTIGRYVIAESLTAVLDVSQMRREERKIFVSEFLSELFHEAKSHRQPHMLVLEEAQLFAPQRGGKEEEGLLTAVEDIVRLGRNYGLGSALITQRPQSVHKEVLNQIECLFVGQLNAKHERKAIEDWIRHHGAPMSFVDELPGLQVGEMVIWSPQWLNLLKKTRIGIKDTYDSSATPELGLDRPVFDLPPIDVSELERLVEDDIDEDRWCTCQDCGHRHEKEQGHE